MSGFQIKVTTAGRAALVNAQNTGTLPVLVSQIGITSTAFVPSAGQTTIPAEIKRLATFGGATVADDTIHVSIRDQSSDVYSMRGFGLYLADGTLFAVYGQAGVIVEKSSLAMMLLAADIIFADIDAASITFGNANFLNPPATTEVQGVVELATNAEANTGTDTQRAITAVALKYTLDQRFGTGAPTAFVKGLLNLATAALVRAAIGLGNAAVRNEGTGNGLDSDLLDGHHGAYYLDWANLTNRPSSYPPSAHSHLWANITDPPATAVRWPSYAEVTDKPTTFPPSNHQHAAADINSGVFDVARIPALPIAQTTGLQIALDGKAAAVHTHTIANVTGLQAALDGKVDAIATAVHGSSLPTAYQNNAVSTSNMTAEGPTGGVATAVTARNNSDSRVAQIAFLANGGTVGAEAYIRSSHTISGGGGWNAWCRLWHSGNFDPASKLNLAEVDDSGLASRVVARNASGDILGRLFRASYPNQTSLGGALAFRINDTTDNYIRFCSDIAAIRNWLAVAAAVHSHVIGDVTGLQGALDAKAPLASPALTGAPTAPTPAANDNSTRVATTAFVQTELADLIAAAPGALDTLNELAAAIGDDANFAATISNALALKAPLASPALTGVPVAPTAAAGTNTTQIATTAFVAALGALKANIASPSFTGVPAAPTAAAGTNSTQLATTAFVAALGALKANLSGATFTGEVGAPSFKTTSSRTVKHRIEGSDYGMREVELLQPILFAYRDDPAQRQRVGLIAEDVQLIVPEAVSDTDAGVPAIDYAQLFPVLVTAVQQLAAEVRELRGCV